VLLMPVTGSANTRIAESVGVSAATVMNWRERFAQGWLEAVLNGPARPWPETVDPG